MSTSIIMSTIPLTDKQLHQLVSQEITLYVHIRWTVKLSHILSGNYVGDTERIPFKKKDNEKMFTLFKCLT